VLAQQPNDREIQREI